MCSKEIKKVIGNKNTTTNIYRIQANDSVICGCLCIRFIDFMLKGKRYKIIKIYTPPTNILKYFP